MTAHISRLRSPSAVQAALDEYNKLGRSAFLDRYGYSKSRAYLVRNPRNGELADAKAIVGVAYGIEHSGDGPLVAEDFSGTEATINAKLQSLGFEVIKVGEDWTIEEVQLTVADYFDMLMHEAQQQKYKKSEHNAQLRGKLKGRSKGSVEMKHQNVSAVLNALGLPFISGYKPRGNTQLLLRQEVQKYVLSHPDFVRRIVDAMEDVKSPGEKTFEAVLVDAPTVETVAKHATANAQPRLPRKLDYAARDESNRKLGRAGEQWVLEYEQRRLLQAGRPELFSRVDWVADRLGDGLGYDILSYDTVDQQRFIEVKTTNGAHASSFIVSRNELDFSEEVGSAFHLYRVFHFRESPKLYVLQGNLNKHLHLEPIDFRASFRRLMA